MIKPSRFALRTIAVALALVKGLQAWVFSVLWGWFVVPLGAPSIGVFAALGLIVMRELVGLAPTAFIVKQTVELGEMSDGDRMAQYVARLIYDVFTPLVLLSVGYGAHYMQRFFP